MAIYKTGKQYVPTSNLFNKYRGVFLAQRFKITNSPYQAIFRNDATLRDNLQLVIAQLAFANSDFAFQGNHLFQGNFYGVNIFDISSPANTKPAVIIAPPACLGADELYRHAASPGADAA